MGSYDISALMIIVLTCIYAAAQLKGGSKALHVLLDWDLSSGAIIGAIIVLAYCFAGGIRASIWTDSAQVIVMLGGLITLIITSVIGIGGIDVVMEKLNNVSDSYMNPLSGTYTYGVTGYIAGWLVAVVAGIIGMPHVMIRFMTVKTPSDATKALPWMTFFAIAIAICVIATALLARIVIPPESFDKELILPMLAQEFMGEVLVGLMLATIFAATISTSDSLILSCAAAITRDLSTKERNSYVWTKAGTIFATVMALLISLFAPANVLGLVMLALSGMAASFAPLIMLYCARIKIPQITAVMMIFLGFITVVLWREFMDYGDMPGALPGMAVSFAIFGISHIVQKFRK